jgi:glutamine synthetase
MTLYSLFRTGLEGPMSDPKDEAKRQRTRFLPDNILDAIRLFKQSKWALDLFGDKVHEKYAELKMTAADRCPKALGTLVKPGEVQFHHEVTNQYLWNHF